MKALLLATLAVLPLATQAENFRCGQWIVTPDSSIEDLLSKCGQPAARDSRTEDVLVRNRNNGLMVKTGETVIETWVYGRGTQAAPMVVTIVDGRIKSIERKQ